MIVPSIDFIYKIWYDTFVKMYKKHNHKGDPHRYE